MSEPRGLTFTREQVEAWVGHSLTDQQVEDIEETLPNSSLPDTVETVAHEALEIPYPEDERTCQHCHQLIHDAFGAWVDRTQGDVCGWDGGNEPHEPIVNEDD